MNKVRVGLFSLFAVFTPVILWAAFNISEVNAKLAEFLAPLNNPSTRAEVSFSELASDSEKILKLAARAFYSKVGVHNSLVLDLKDLSYDFDENAGPITRAELKIEFDLWKLLGRQDFNYLENILKQVLTETKEEYLRFYGEALFFDLAFDQLNYDANGDLVDLKFHLEMSVDPEFLPKETPIEEVLLLEAQVEVEITRKSASAEIWFLSNKEYKGLGERKEGLKEIIDGFLNGDEKNYRQLFEVVGYLDQMANDLVNSPGQN